MSNTVRLTVYNGKLDASRCAWPVLQATNCLIVICKRVLALKLWKITTLIIIAPIKEEGAEAGSLPKPDAGDELL